MPKTLEELKAENAAEEQRLEEEKATQDQEEVIEAEDETEEVALNDESDLEPNGDEEKVEEGDTEEESEAWMQSDDQGSEDEETVPLSVLTKTRSKLKGKVNEQASEIDDLKAQVAKLQANNQSITASSPKSMPKLEDFDYDEAKFQKANADWIQSQITEQIQSASKQQEIAAKQQQAMRDTQEAVDAHYTRAAQLAEKSNIEPELYQSADLKVRQVIDSVVNGQGDAITDVLIARLGEGSEKVMYYLGRNPKAQETLKSKLLTDPNGISAAIYLGSLHSQITIPQQRKSRATPPAKQIKGGNTTPSPEGKLKKSYQDAHRRGNSQAAFDARREARAAGIDTSNW